METDSHVAFHLPHARVPIQICLKRIIELRPHEETVHEELEAMIDKMRGKGVIRHPIVADTNTGTVLDGTHRLAALSILGYEYVPAALIDYQSPLISLSRWFRIVSGEKLGRFVDRLKEFHPIEADPTVIDRGLLDRSSFAGLHDGHIGYYFPTEEKNALVGTKKAFKIEKIARDNGMKISYSDTPQIEKTLPEQFVLSGILVTKTEVVNAARKKQLFPPKTTRHMIPSRPLATRTPLEWLRGRSQTEAERLFHEHLQSKKVRRLPEGSWVGSRRYQEEVFLFE